MAEIAQGMVRDVLNEAILAGGSTLKDFANADGGLLAGQFVRVRVTGGKAKDATLVPQLALVQAPSGRSVFVVGAGDRAELMAASAADGLSAVIEVAGMQDGHQLAVAQQGRAQ